MSTASANRTCEREQRPPERNVVLCSVVRLFVPVASFARGVAGFAGICGSRLVVGVDGFGMAMTPATSDAIANPLPESPRSAARQGTTVA
jgi:hypothetical protein